MLRGLDRSSVTGKTEIFICENALYEKQCSCIKVQRLQFEKLDDPCKLSSSGSSCASLSYRVLQVETEVRSTDRGAKMVEAL